MNDLKLKLLQGSELLEEDVRWFDDSDLMKYYTNSKRSYTTEQVVQSIVDQQNDLIAFTYGIYYGNKLIGTVKVGPINHVHKISDLVVLIGDKNYHGKGLAVQAIKLGNEVAFEKHGIRKLYGGMYAGNLSSIKAYLRANWMVEGRLKGFYQVDGKSEDRILVTCLNPKYFNEQEFSELRSREQEFLEINFKRY